MSEQKSGSEIAAEHFQNGAWANTFRCALILAHQKNPSALPTLLQALRHPVDSYRRKYAIDALKQIGFLAIPTLQRELHTPGSVCVGAALALYKIDQGQYTLILPMLRKALYDRQSMARRDAIWAIGEIGVEGREVVPDLIAVLNNEKEDINLRCDALNVLTRVAVPDRSILDTLTAVLDNPDQTLRLYAIQALGRLGAAALPTLSTLINSLYREQEFVLRLHTIYNLVRIAQSAYDEEEAAPAVEALRQLLSDDDNWIRVFALRALAQLRERSLSALPDVIASLSDRHYDVQRNAIYTIAQIGISAKQAIPALYNLLQETRLSGAAAEALAIMGRASHDILISALDSRNDNIRLFAAHALLKTNIPEAREQVEQAVDAEFRFLLQPELLMQPAPTLSFSLEITQAFEDLYRRFIASGTGEAIDYTLPYPKYDFLRYLSAKHDVVFYGSDQSDLDVISPLRTANELDGELKSYGILADTDGIQPLYKAIIDQKQTQSVHGKYINLPGRDGKMQRYYRFTIDVESLHAQPWTTGMLYILPRQPFIQMDDNEWICRKPLCPLARLPIKPTDFPFLDRIMGSDPYMAPTSGKKKLKNIATTRIYLDDIQTIAVCTPRDL